MASTTRPSIPERTKLLVWGRAAGRCTFCNQLVTENEQLGEPVPVGELAHNVGWGKRSPRGGNPLPDDERQDPANLILACRNCHKPIDDGGVVGRYDDEELRRRKREHETRIRRLTAIGADRGAYVLRAVGDIRGVPPALNRQTVLAAATTAGLYPKILPGSHWEDIDLDLRQRGDLDSREAYQRLLPDVEAFVRRVHDGVRLDDTARVAVFAFARIPLLVALGALLDDKVPALVFQRHRSDEANAWTWQSDVPATDFETVRLREGSDSAQLALLLNLSGTITADELPAAVTPAHHVYAVQPVAAAGTSVFANPRSLANFEAVLRGFLAQVEAEHGKPSAIDLFPAVGVAPAVTIGRVLMPNVSPAWRVYDRGADGQFFLALEVRR